MSCISLGACVTAGNLHPKLASALGDYIKLQVAFTVCFFFLGGKKKFGASKSRSAQIPCAVRWILQLFFVTDVLLWCFAIEDKFQPCAHRPREPSGGKTCSISAGTTASPRKFCSTAAWCGASSLGPPQTPKVEYPAPPILSPTAYLL